MLYLTGCPDKQAVENFKLYINWNGIDHLVQNGNTVSIQKSVRLEIFVPVPDSFPPMECTFTIFFKNKEKDAYKEHPGRHGYCMTDIPIENVGNWEIRTTLSYDSRRKGTNTVRIHVGE